MRTLYNYQRQVLDWAKAQSNPALFLSMRLGKTLTTIRLANVWGARRILVVAPLSVLASWETELTLEGLSGIRVDRDTNPGQAFAVGGWWLVGYERLLRIPELAKLPWDLVVADESTKLRNPQAQITKLMTRGFRDATHRVVLSGLPAPEGPLDYFSQFQFLHGSFLGCKNYWQFRNKYFRQKFYDWVPHPATLTLVKSEVHTKGYVLSRHTAGIGEKKVYSRRMIPMNAEQKRLVKAIENGFELGPEEQTNWTVVCSNWLSRVAGGHGYKWGLVNDGKARQLVELLRGELKAESVIVFFRYTREIMLCEERLRRAGIRVAVMTGATHPTERAERCRKFQEGRIPVLLLQIAIGKFGLNLARASTAIYYSNSYSMENRAQSEDRIVHPEKREPLLYIDLVTEGSIDEDLLDALRTKRIESRFFLQKTLEKYLERTGLRA